MLVRPTTSILLAISLVTNPSFRVSLTKLDTGVNGSGFKLLLTPAAEIRLFLPDRNHPCRIKGELSKRDPAGKVKKSKLDAEILIGAPPPHFHGSFAVFLVWNSAHTTTGHLRTSHGHCAAGLLGH